MDTTHHIAELETRLILALKTNNIAELDALLHNNVIFTNQNGHLLNKEADLESHRSGELEVYDVETSEQHINLFGDTAIVSVVKNMNGEFAGHAFVGIYRYTRVWKNDGVKWQIIAAHSSQVI
jgi:glycosyltransferase involved in cell wall biosynthesis